MAGFNAGSVVEPLDYNFEPFVPGRKGTITEPDDKQIAAYLAGIRETIQQFRGQLPDTLIAGGTDITAVLSAVEDLDTEIQLKLSEALAGVNAALCSGTPSKDDILRLPPRIRGMFFGWLQREVMSPEAAPGGGTAQVTTLRSAAAG